MTRMSITLAAGLVAVLASAAALAQADPSGASPDTTSPQGAHGAATGGADSTVSNGQTPAAPTPMTDSDKRMASRCRALAPSAAAKDGRCKALAGAHPELFNSDGAMKSGATPG